MQFLKHTNQRNSLWITLISICSGIQIVLALSLLVKFIPLKVDTIFLQQPDAQQRLRPEFEVLLFSLGLVSVVVIQSILVWVLRRRMTQSTLETRLKSFLIIESILVFVLVSAWYKTIVYDYRPFLANVTLIVFLVLSLLHKIFYKDVSNLFSTLHALIARYKQHAQAKLVLTLVSVLAIAGIIYTPDIDGSLARMFIGEQFHHWDIFIMSPGWAALNGHQMNVDQISQYGVGLPIMISHLAQLMGGFTYHNVLWIFVVMTVMYYVAWFLILRRWWGGLGLVMAAIITGLRVQMFHPGVYPSVLTYPSSLVIRYFFDVIVFWAILNHLTDHRRGWLWAAAFSSGIAIFYMDSTGLFLTVTFYAYLMLRVLIPHPKQFFFYKFKDIAVVIALLSVPLITAGLLFYLAVGQHLFTAVFWQNMLETIDYFLSGIGTYPMYESFKYHMFFPGVVGFIIPVVYVVTMLFVSTLCFWKKRDITHLLIVILCVYGLGLNHYYIARSLQTSYYVAGLPFIIVCFYWVREFIGRFSPQQQRAMTGWVLALSIYALATTHMFMAYPNMFNISRHPLTDPHVALPLPTDGAPYFNHLFRKEGEETKTALNNLGQTDEQLYRESDFANDAALRDYYDQEFDFNQDAALIEHYTAPQDQVALISSFETKILMQANRRPFFYYFPLVNSRPMHMRSLTVNFLHTSTERFLEVALNQLHHKAPEYVFMEKIFLTKDIPKGYLDRPENIVPILNYINQHYHPVAQGKYLVALQRN